MNWVHPISLLIASVVAVFMECAFTGLRGVLVAQPDFVSPLVVYAALNASLGTTAATAVLGGLASDALSAGPFGPGAIPLTVLGVLLHRRRDLLLRDSTWAQVLLGGTGAVAVSVTSLMLLCVLWPLVASSGTATPSFPERREGLMALPVLSMGVAWQIAIVGVVGAATTPLVFRLFRWVEATFHYQPIPRAPYRADREIQRRRR